jgi:O-acetyl-ADP-ribose deacetylase (regulator of RNase III)
MNGKVEFVIGDITSQQVDAIVNAANTDLLLGAGVAGAIRRAGGPAIQEECSRIGPIPLGQAAITRGGHLPAAWVIHAAGMHLGGGVSAKACADATRHSLERAAEKGLRSVAFPAIGTGVGGLGMAECARVMLGEARAHLRGESGARTSVERVVFVLFDDAARVIFERTWNDIRGTSR